MAGSTTLSPSQRALRARVAAYALHAQGGTSTAAATAAFLGRFERAVIQAAAERGEELTPAEIAKRAAQARKSYMSGLALRASIARSRKHNKAAAEGQSPATAASIGHGDGRSTP